MKIYRITREKWAGKLTASGYSARWNNDNMFVLYTAASISLACLEMLVHTKEIGDNIKYSITVLEIPDSLKIKTVSTKSLPHDWNKTNHKTCKDIGKKWYDAKEHLVLCVPSAIIEQEKNYLINTLHPDFSKIKVAEIFRFDFDERLFKNFNI